MLAALAVVHVAFEAAAFARRAVVAFAAAPATIVAHPAVAFAVAVAAGATVAHPAVASVFAVALAVAAAAAPFWPCMQMSPPEQCSP